MTNCFFPPPALVWIRNLVHIHLKEPYLLNHCKVSHVNGFKIRHLRLVWDFSSLSCVFIYLIPPNDLLFIRVQLCDNLFLFLFMELISSFILIKKNLQTWGNV